MCARLRDEYVDDLRDEHVDQRIATHIHTYIHKYSDFLVVLISVGLAHAGSPQQGINVKLSISTFPTLPCPVEILNFSLGLS